MIDESMICLHENEVTDDAYDSVHVTGHRATMLLINIWQFIVVCV
jgi:hypothetical protein